MGKADRRRIRHPHHHAFSDRWPEDHDGRHRRFRRRRAVLLDRTDRTAGRNRHRRSAAQSGIGSKGDFPGPLFLAVAPVEVEWPQRLELGARRPAEANVDYDDLLRVSGGGEFTSPIIADFLFGSVADHLAETFGTKGSPISLSTACASGATAIQLGVEAIRRGEADAALCVATDGSVNPEALVRFSLLSALSTQNEPPQAASKPFSKNRDGFVMAEGAGALVLESYDAARRAARTILGVLAGCGELTDSFHRTRSSPDGKPIIGCVRKAWPTPA